MGVGRPNCTADEVPGIGAPNRRFNLHMSIDQLSGPEFDELNALLQDSEKLGGNRKALKERLGTLMKARKKTDFKSGHKLINALNNLYSDDFVPD